MGQLREEAKEAAIQSASLFADLEKAQAEVEQLEEDLESIHRANTLLVTPEESGKDRARNCLGGEGG